MMAAVPCSVRLIWGLMACVLLAVTAQAQSSSRGANPARAQVIAATPGVEMAIQELLERYGRYLKSNGLPTQVSCEPVMTWSFPGRIEAAAAWIGREVKRRGWRFASEAQLRHSYAFTAVSGELHHLDDGIFGGLIEEDRWVTIFLQRCHPIETNSIR